MNHQMKSRSNWQKRLAAGSLCMLFSITTIGCKENQTNAGPVAKTEKLESTVTATLAIATWDSAMIVLFNELNITGRFQKLYPNVTIEVEQSKDDMEYWDNMHIRAAANQLPDIMLNKPFTVSRFQNYLYDLSDTEAARNNKLAQVYALDGKILGIPEKSVSDYVYYWSDMFEKAGVSVPQTWNEFTKACTSLQRYYGTEDKNYSALAIGAKDEWPTYPFMEYMPCLITGNGDVFRQMTAQEHPFDPQTDVSKAYEKAFQLFSSGVCGENALGIGHDQAVSNFAQRKSAMIVAGPWCLSTIKESGRDLTGLKTFYLPVRDQVDEPLRIVVQGDNMMGVTHHSSNPELAKAFVEFYFSADWYPDYISKIGDASTMENFPKEKDPILADADEAKTETILYQGGGVDFTKIQKQADFDYKRLGSQMFIEGFDLKQELARLNENWAAAKIKIELKARER